MSATIVYGKDVLNDIVAIIAADARKHGINVYDYSDYAEKDPVISCTLPLSRLVMASKAITIVLQLHALDKGLLKVLETAGVEALACMVMDIVREHDRAVENLN